MRLLVDAGIPAAFTDFEHFGSIVTAPGPKIDRGLLNGVDALIVRSVTRVGEPLLGGSSVRFVGSATAGIDHVNVPWLSENGIHFAHAPGANADSVADYVVASLLTLALKKGRSLQGLRMLIVGCGEVGSRVARRAQALGLQVSMNDPPREDRGAKGDWVTLERGLETADVVSVHVPLESAGRYQTTALIGQNALDALHDHAWLIHTARGGVVDESALKRWMRRPSWNGAVVLDVWENEPAPDAGLIEAVDIATPHIAGYARESKANASRAIQRALAAFTGLPVPPEEHRAMLDLRVSPPDGLEDPLSLERFMHTLSASMYDILRDDASLRGHHRDQLRGGSAFEALRSGYPGRHLFSRYAGSLEGVPKAWRAKIRGALMLGP